MKQVLMVSVIGAGLVSLACAGRAVEAEAGSGDMEAQLSAMNNVALARDLAAFARRNNAPECLLAAARVLAAAPGETVESVKPPQDEIEADQPKIAEEKAPAAGALPDDPKALVHEAREMGKGNESLLGLADQVENQLAAATRAFREPGGAWQHCYVGQHTVPARQTAEFVLEFTAHDQSLVALSGDGDTDLDLFVYDPYGNLVASDTDALDDCVARWLPRKAGTYRIQVKNLGRVYNNYRMMVLSE